MVRAQHSIEIDAPADKVFDMVADFARYPDVLRPEVEETVVRKKSKNAAEVEFTVKLVKRVHYTLKYKLVKPKNITWSMVDGDSILKTNSGRYVLAKLDGSRTRLTCTMDVEFGGWVPNSIVGSLMNSHLPSMLRRFKEHAEE